MYEYGNTRIAARRGMLLSAESLERLAESGSPAAAVAQLERRAEWRWALEAARPVTSDGGSLLQMSIELRRSGELSALPEWFEGPPRRLVEALVAGLDRERVVALLRRRRAGQDAEAINPTIVGGALLDGAALADLAREPTLGGVFAALRRHGLLERRDAAALVRSEAMPVGEVLETALDEAWDRCRAERAAGTGTDAARVRSLLGEETAERAAVRDELATGGPAAAALIERSLRLARLDRVAHEGRRDSAGIGTVAGYVAAVEAEAIRLRVVLARLAAGWSRQVARDWLAGSGI